jgi:AbrB family looped-hinge helix DNA binding protein
MENNNEKISQIKCHDSMRGHHERMRRHHEGTRMHSERIIVKGYMRPDGTSYYVVIPKEVREQFQLKGGEYFVIRAKPWENEINLKLAKFVEEEQK